MRVDELRYRIGTMRRQRPRVAFYRQFVGKGDLAFDIGAHVGDRTMLLLQTGATVVAVEPHPALQPKLERLVDFNRRAILVPEAVGSEPGEAELRWPSQGLPVASMSDEWIERVRASGRFDAEWDDRVVVRVTTLDALIERHGLPAFCKIDVEGYEEAVLCGLSQPIAALSIEFTPEYLDSTERSLRRLGELGEYCFNYCLGESLKLVEGRWLTPDELLLRLQACDRKSFGDVYARLVG